MNEMLQFMLIIFGTSEYDWLGFKVTGNNPLTCHYIRKYNDGGEKTVNNMALLTIGAHRYLHDIEQFDIELYNKINMFLKNINQQRRYPNNDEYAMCNEWFSQYEKCNKDVLMKLIKSRHYNEKVMKQFMQGGILFHPVNFRMNLQSGINLYDERVTSNKHEKMLKRRKSRK